MYYSQPSLNSDRIELFEWKFKRKPKEWALEQIQDLWIRAEERNEKRREIISVVYDKVINEMPENDKKEKVVYFTSKDKVYSYNFRYCHDFRSYGYSSNLVTFSNDKTVARDEKIEFILSNDKAFELGQEFKGVQKLKTSLHLRVKRIFLEKVEEHLKKVYKDKFPPDITVVKVGSKKYYFAADEQNRYSYLQFHFKGEVKDNIIEL